MKRILQVILGVLCSYGLAIVVLFLLLVLTLLGTWEQKNLGLFEVQRRYFTSFFLLHDFGPIRLPLPGVYLLLIIFTINLVLGTAVRIQPSLSRIGLYVAHLGMLILLMAALVTHYFAMEGQMTLAPGERSNIVSSYHEWELAVIDYGPARPAAGSAAEYVIDLADLTAYADAKPHPIQSAGLPFALSIDALWRNARVMPKGPMFAAPTPVVNGFFVQPLPVAQENERNLPALYIQIAAPGTPPQSAILWGASDLPYHFTTAGHDWALLLRHRSWQIPFAIELMKFTRTLHPGTDMAKSFESDVHRIEAGQSTPVTIRMNEPLRYGGFTFFQASFAEDAQAAGGYTSTFAVVKNPADQWPLYACIVITAGMLLHFALKLLGYLGNAREEEMKQGDDGAEHSQA
jgi:hypothetical protein